MSSRSLLIALTPPIPASSECVCDNPFPAKDIQISSEYHALRSRELSLTADYLSKQQEEKEAARAERERLREEEKARAEYRREQERLLKEKTHYLNALEALQAAGDQKGIAGLHKKIDDVDSAIEGIKSREANIRAGYVYVISNIGSFGERMVKIGMTRRLDPMDRVRELGDASVPFRYDIHALFFSEDAVGIEAKLHRELEQSRVNRVNLRREFFYATPSEVKEMLLNHAGNLLDYAEVPEALEYWQSRGSDGDVKPLERAVVT
jgi:seryl-tRNA synthetase